MSLVGLLISLYLWLWKLGLLGPMVCVSGGCETVQMSEYGLLLGYPVALYGVFGFPAILGVSLFMVIRGYSFVACLAYGAGSGVGWALAILAMSGLRQKMKRSRVHPALEGAGITLIIAGIMALAFTGFSGMVPM